MTILIENSSGREDDQCMSTNWHLFGCMSMLAVVYQKEIPLVWHESNCGCRYVDCEGSRFSMGNVDSEGSRFSMGSQCILEYKILYCKQRISL